MDFQSSISFCIYAKTFQIFVYISGLHPANIAVRLKIEIEIQAHTKKPSNIPMQEDFTAYIRLPLVYRIRGSISISRLNVIKTTPRYMVLVMLDPLLILFTFRLKAEGNSLLLLHF